MKRKVLAIVLCLSMLFSSQAFAMGIPEEHTSNRQTQEIAANMEQAAESSAAIEQAEESSSDEASTEESSSDAASTEESSSDAASTEESSSDETSTEDDNENDTIIFSDDKGTSFILVDENCVPVEEEAKANGAAVYRVTSEDASFVIPTEAADSRTNKTWPVIALYEYALADNDSFQNIQIPDSVTVIGKGAFSGCEKLEEITIPTSVKIIGEAAFKDCISLKKIYFSGSPDIAADAFDGVKATAYYPLSWSEVPASDAFGGTIKWVLSIPEPSNLKAVSASYNSAKISWSKLSGADGYIIYRKNGSKWDRLNVTAASSYTDKKLVCGQSYTYTVRAYKTVNEKNVNGAYDKKGVTARILPATVKLGEATASGSNIQITWSKVSGASGYKIYRLDPNTVKWKGLKSVNSSAASYTDKNLKADQYTYTVRAYRTVSDEKIFGNYNKKGISAYITPAAPKLTGVSGSSKSITVQWSTIAGAEGYRIYRKSNAADKWKKLADVTGEASTSYKDTKATKGTYFYTVRAYIKVDDSTIWGDYHKTGITVTIPAQPKLVSAVASMSKKQSVITIKWEAVPNADGYRVYRKTGDGGWKTLTTQKGNTLSVVDKNVTSGEIYTYTVRAYVNAGSKPIFGTYDKKGITTVGYMEAPEIFLAASWYDNSYTIADLFIFWTELENVDGYILYYKDTADSDWNRLEKMTANDAHFDDGLCAGMLEEVDLSNEYLFTVRPYKMVDGKEFKGAYNKKGVSTNDAEDLDEMMED